MGGAFLGISVSSRARISRKARRQLLDTSSTVGGPIARRWGAIERGATALLTWERTVPIATRVSHRPDRATMSIGTDAGGDDPAAPSSVIGPFSAVVADKNEVTAWADDLGYGTIFHWETPRGISAISTRPELLARLATALGLPPSKDPSIAAEMGYLGWLSPSRTGWREISALRAGERITLRDGRSSTRLDPDVAAWAHRPPDDESRDDLLARAEMDVRANVDRLLDTDHDIVVDLTAGRDSRMVVAAVHACGGLDRVTLQTIGGLGLTDVHTAQSLAEHLGAKHRSGFFYPASEGSFAERFVHHVRVTAGTANAMKGMREHLGTVDHLRIAGQMGEVIRGWPTPVPRDTAAREIVDSIGSAFQAGRLDVLRPPAREEARERLRVELLETGHSDVAGWFAAHRYYAEVRLRARMSRVGDFVPETRSYPLYSRNLTSTAMKILWHHGDTDLADELIERLAPGLDAAGAAIAAAITRPETDARPVDQSFMRSALAQQVDVRQEFFTATAGRESAAWDWLDRGAFTAAAADYAGLSHPQKRLIHGAAGAVHWLSDDDS